MSKRLVDIFCWAGTLIAAIGLVCLLALPALAQEMEHRHALGHGEYTEWASRKTSNCCNNQDCHYLTQDEYRETAAGTELKVGKSWCPVKGEHLVIKGKSPDWSKKHACINQYTSYQDECDRILCYMEEGGT